MLTDNTEQRKSRPQSRGKKIFRLCFRCCRIFILMVLLVLVTSLFFLNKVGLPEFVKSKVLAQLQAKGWEGGFSRLRLRFYRGIVAENLFLERANKEPGPHVFVDEAVCHFDYRALTHRAIVVDAVRLRGGKLIWPMAHTNQPLPAAQISDVQGLLKFNPNDQWELSDLSGQIVGLHVRITGTLTNASFVRDWKLQRRPGDKRLSEESLRRLMQTWQQIKFAGPPQIDIKFGANAANVKESSAQLDCRGSGVASPWLTGTNFLLVARLMPSPLSNEWFQATVELKAEMAHLPKIGADTRLLQLSASLQPPFTNLFPVNANLVFTLEEPHTRSGSASHVDLSAHITPDPSSPGTLKTDLSLAAFDVKTKWLRSTNIQLALAATHSSTNWSPATIAGRVQVRHPDSNQGRADLATMDFQGSIPPTNQWRLAQTNLDWPSRVANFPLRGNIQVSNVHSPKLELTTLAMTADWKAPLLEIKTDVRLYDGTLSAEARLETTTRDLAFKAVSHFDPHKAERLLTTNSQRWLASYAWENAPKLRAEGRVRLPDWMDREVDWKKEVMPAFAVSGDFEVGQGSYRGIPFSSARSPFIFTNMIWHIPSLKVTRPEGSLEADYYSDQRTRDFHWELRSGIDPKIIRPLFTTPQSQRIFDLLQFGSPPQIEAELWGRWYDTQRLGGAGKVTLTNCSFRGEKVDYASTWVRYTNELISLFEPKAQAGGREGNAQGIAIDLVTQKLYFTNAVGDLDPYSVGRAISKRTAEILEPYHFDVPPVVKVSGSVDLKKGRHEDDMHFELAGHRFQWQTYLLQQITGNIDWTGRHLSLTNIHGTFRTGQIAGNADFYFQSDNGSVFTFNISAADVDLHTFVQQTGLKTNKLEGSLTGEIHVTRGVTENWRSVDGNGRLQLKDGLLWDIPVFGVFSPVLNTIIPGLGNSRAKEGTASFVMTNGTLFTKDLEIRASAMRMNYQGTVDLRDRVDGRMEAELLRDLPAIGFVISKVLWPVTKLFEYRITGTLSDPKTQPLYVLPKILLMPFHPIKTIKDLIPEDSKPAPEPPPTAPAPPKPS